MGNARKKVQRVINPNDLADAAGELVGALFVRHTRLGRAASRIARTVVNRAFVTHFTGPTNSRRQATSKQLEGKWEPISPGVEILRPSKKRKT